MASTDVAPLVDGRQPLVTQESGVSTISGPLMPREVPTKEDVIVPPKGLFWIMLTNMVISVNYSMMMVTGAAYTVDYLHKSTLFYGAAVAAFPIGRIIMLMPMGYWSDKGRFGPLFAVCNVLSIIGGIMYGMASVAENKIPGCGAGLAMAGRLIGGVGATQPVSAWAARGYPPEKRARVESMQKSMNLMGVIVGPALNAFVADLHVNIPNKEDPWFTLNTETAAGYFPALLSIVLLVGCLLYVEEPPPNEDTPEDEVEENPWKVLLSSGAWVCLLLAFQTNLQLAAIDTVLAKLNEDLLGWSVVLNSLAFAVIAVLCLVGAAAAIILLTKGTKCTVLIAIGLVFNFCVSVPGMWVIRNAPDPELMDPVVTNMTLFLIFGGLQCIAIMFYTGPTGGLFQQACGKKQGLLGGVYLMFFAAGRPCGSMLGGVLLNGVPLPLVITTPLTIVVCLVLHLSVYKRLQKTDDEALAANADFTDANMESLERSLSTNRFSFSGADQVGR